MLIESWGNSNINIKLLNGQYLMFKLLLLLNITMFISPAAFSSVSRCKEIVKLLATDSDQDSIKSIFTDDYKIQKRIKMSIEMRNDHLSDRIFDAGGNISAHIDQII